MVNKVRLAVVGVGNNTSALVQGLEYYRKGNPAVGICRPDIAGLGVSDVSIEAAFALSESKVGRDLHSAVFASPNNFPRIVSRLPPPGIEVQRGLTTPTETTRITRALQGLEVLLYSAPSGRPDIALAYAKAAIAAGVAFVNTTSDPVARDSQLLANFESAKVPLVGDDLMSQFGTSALHHALLRLLAERGISLTSSYQVNLGGTEDFRNLVDNPGSKHQSKLNAVDSDRVHIAPLGYLPHLGSQKIAHINIEGQGWGGTNVSLDLHLRVHDPSGAAGVNIDLVRFAAAALRDGRGGFLEEASGLLKSPPGTAL